MMESELEKKRMYQGSGAPPRRKKKENFVTPIKMDVSPTGLGIENEERY